MRLAATVASPIVAFRGGRLLVATVRLAFSGPEKWRRAVLISTVDV